MSNAHVCFLFTFPIFISRKADHFVVKNQYSFLKANSIRNLIFYDNEKNILFLVKIYLLIQVYKINL